MRRPLLIAALLFSAAACGLDRSAGGPTGGSIVIGEAADADALLPPLVASITGRIASELMFDPLAELGPSLNVVGDSAFAPRLAQRWDWSADSLTITFHIDPAARWHDGQPVSGRDVAFAFRTIRDPAVASPVVSNLSNIDSVVAIDSLTATVHFARRYAEQFFHATRIVPIPAHRLAEIPAAELRTHAEALTPVGSGRFKFVAWEPRVRLELGVVPDHHRGRAKLDRVLFAISSDADAGFAQVLAGEADVWDQLTPASVNDVASRDHLRVVTGPGYDYGFMTFNFRDARNRDRPHPLFSDRALRRALTMAVDRDAVRRAALDSLGLPGVGPFVRDQATADTTIEQIPFDRVAAEAALDSLGWTTRGADGIRRKGTQRLAFGISVPSSSAPRMRAAVVIQEQFRQVGVEATVRSTEFQTFRGDIESGRFDATIWIWRTSPSPTSLRGTWASTNLPGGGAQNLGRYDSPPFDKAVMDGINATDLATRKASLRRAYQQIADDAPAIWLFEVRNLAAVHKRFSMPAWRSDAWWLNLGEWTVDPGQRLPRDAPPAAP